jgi:hypothetical protein
VPRRSLTLLGQPQSTLMASLTRAAPGAGVGAGVGAGAAVGVGAGIGMSAPSSVSTSGLTMNAPHDGHAVKRQRL